MPSRRSSPILCLVVPILASVLLLLAVGCGGKTVVGTWDVSGTPVPTVMELKPDNTFVSTLNAGIGSIEITGTYKVEGEKFSFTGTDVKTGSLQLPAAIKEPLLKTVKSTTEGTLKWENKDSFTVTSSQQSFTFKRQPPANATK